MHTHTHTHARTHARTHTHTLLYALALVAVDTVHDTDVDACDCTLRLYRHCKRVCTGSWLWEKNPLPQWGLNPALALRLDFLSWTLYQLNYICSQKETRRWTRYLFCWLCDRHTACFFTATRRVGEKISFSPIFHVSSILSWGSGSGSPSGWSSDGHLRSLTLFYFNSLSIFFFAFFFFYYFLSLFIHQAKTMCQKHLCF